MAPTTGKSSWRSPPRTIRLLAKKSLSLSELENIPIVVRNHGTFESTTQSLLRTLKKPGRKRDIAMRCESPEAVQSAVTQNLGIGLLYYDAVKAAIERGSFKIVPIRGLNIEGQTYIVYHNERSLSPNAEEFLKLLRDWRAQQTSA